MTQAQQAIVEVLAEIREILLEKNRKYGNSAIEPVRIFSRASPLEQINVRLDDKLSRIASGQADEDEDVELDLVGYLVLKRVARRLATKPEEATDGQGGATAGCGGCGGAECGRGAGGAQG